MSVSKWAYEPEKCDGDYCVGDCDFCHKAEGDEEVTVEEIVRSISKSICKSCKHRDFCAETLRLYGLPNMRVDECIEYEGEEE